MIRDLRIGTCQEVGKQDVKGKRGSTKLLKRGLHEHIQKTTVKLKGRRMCVSERKGRA